MKIIYPKKCGFKVREDRNKEGIFVRQFNAKFRKWHLDKVGTPYVEHERKHQP